MKKKTKAHCNNCQGERNHEILFEEQTYWSHDESGFCGKDLYEMLKCSGCDCIILRHTSWFSEDPGSVVTIYPPSAFRREPGWIDEMSGRSSDLVRTLLKEIYVGVQNDMKMIATMGVRALLEYVMVDSVGDQGAFTKNLKEFQGQGFISSKQEEILEAVLEAGHATIHRAYQPSYEDLHTCIDIAESVLQTVYVHPDKATELKSRVPKRIKVSTKSSTASK